MKPQSRVYSRYFTYIKPIGQLPIVKAYGTTIFTLFVMTIFIVFAIKPTIETILVLQKKLADSDNILESVSKKASDLSLGKQNYENLNEKIQSKVAAAIPNTAQVRSIVQTLEQTTNNHQASISALQFQPLTLEAKEEEKVGTLAEITFNFNIEAEYRNLISLLQELETSDRLISIDHLSLSKPVEENRLIMAISGKAYYLR